MSQDILTEERIFRHTKKEINDRILTNMKMSVLYYEKNPDQIAQRLQELDREWDIERYLETNASIISLFGLMGAAFGKKLWLIIPVMVLSFLLQHAIQGWCPPVELFRRLGIRTKEEISRERNLLKTIRGDFDEAARVKASDGQAHLENILSMFKS